MERWLTYDQISLIPTQVSTIEHRADVDISVQFGPWRLGVPIIAAPMPDVSNGVMAATLQRLGSLGWIHRFQTLTEAIGEGHFIDATGTPYMPIPGKMPAIAISLKDHAQWVLSFYEFGCRIFCLDTANGASVRIQEAIGRLKDKYPDIFIIAGNVASAEAFQKLDEWGADAVRVGIAGGSVCETRTETGVYSPMASVIEDVVLSKEEDHWELQEWHGDSSLVYGSKYVNTLVLGGSPRNRKALLIADGGIKTPSDMCKALALGADVVMMGGALAGTKESPGEIIKLDGKLYKKLRGAASFGVQKETNGEEPNYVEGTETLVPYVGSVEKVINRFAAGLRSSMSYMNAKTLEEYRRNVKIVEI